ncbi:MAG: tetratricopeptide repeat protein [Deltaproteobacteria bacterium]|jgi:tetratricopeptide (TPR) repeat protein|nr:tetratricopeptide repeat protein [Deltaproteobacteria bacterium]
MKKFCDGHPTRKAHWHCSHCDARLCPECVAQRESESYGHKQIRHFCPKCNQQVDWVGVENLIDPFWNRMPRIFAYPISVAPLILMAVLALATMFFSGPGLFSMLMKGTMWLIVVKYSFEALKATASGNLRPPPVNSETISDDFGQVFKQFGIYIAIFIAFGWISLHTGLFVGIIFLLGALFFVPSMIMLLVTTGSLINALNPVMFVGLTFRIGWAYFLMYFFLFLLGSAPAYLFQFLIQYLPAQTHLLLYGFAESFYTIVSYHLMGYVILQYHDRIGYKVDFEDFEDPNAEDFKPGEVDPDEAILREVAPLIQEGQLDKAIATIQKMTVHQGIKGINLSERYYTLLKMQKRQADLLEHGVNHLDKLVDKSQKNRALAVFSECRKMDANFMPTAAALFKLAGWLNETGKTQAAVSLYNSLVKSYPQHPLVPKSYFRIAQLFHDGLLKTDKAKKILSALKMKYPEHEIRPHVENFLARL